MTLNLIPKYSLTILLLNSIFAFSQNNNDTLRNKIGIDYLKLNDLGITDETKINTSSEIKNYKSEKILNSRNESLYHKLQAETNRTNPIDTDSDGISNDLDIDDDNDGILDTNESTVIVNLDNNIFLNGSLEGISSITFNPPYSWQGVPFNSPICQASYPGGATADILTINGPMASGGVFGVPQEGRTFVSGLHSYYPITLPNYPNPTLWHEGIEQVVNLTSNQTYILGFYQADVQMYNNLDGTGTWKVFLNDTEIFQSNLTIPNSAYDNPNLTWEEQIFTFTTNVTGPNKISFLPFDNDSNITQPDGIRIGIDNIRLTSPQVIFFDNDNDGVFNHLDLDSDNDGISDLFESGLNALILDPDNDGVINQSQFADTNSNGLADAVESIYGQNNGIIPNNTQQDNDTIADYVDLDSDGDTIPDAIEAQLTTNYASNFPNDGNVTDDDSDSDGIIDIYDTRAGHGGNFNYPQNSDNSDSPDYIDIDSDNDNIFDIIEVGHYNLDTNNDGTSDNSSGTNGIDNTLESFDNYNDPDFQINNPALLPDQDSDVFSGGDVDYRDSDITVGLVSNGPVCIGNNVTFNISTAIPNATITYNINNGVSQSAFLDSNGDSTVSILNPSQNLTFNIINIALTNGVTIPYTVTYISNVIPLPIVDSLNDVETCGNYMLQPLVNGNYFTGQNGTGTALFAGDMITSAQTVYIYSETGTTPNCFAESSFVITTNSLSTNNYSETKCDDLNDGNEVIDLSSYNANLVSVPSDCTFEYYSSLAGATNQTSTELVSSISNYNLTIGLHTIYIRITSNRGCIQIAQLDLTLVSTPIITIPDIVPICENDNIIVDAGLGFDSYLWSTGETSQTITVSQAGNYSVTVTEDYGSIDCSSTKHFNVVLSNIATITNIETQDWTNTENIITVNTTGFGNYEYSIDGIHYQDSNVFSGLNCGEYTVYVRDKNGCGITTENIFLLMYPKFFTPNGDGYNDTWSIKFSWLEPGLKVTIFDRYGKFLKELINSDSWDGKYNGHELPSTDYWFVVTRANGKEYREHFTLKR